MLAHVQRLCECLGSTATIGHAITGGCFRLLVAGILCAAYRRYLLLPFFSFKGRAMQNAVILINTDKGQVKAVAERLADVEGISEVYSTCGRYDLVAIARTRDFESLAELVTERLNAVEGISDTETLNAMQVHSRHDLETMFSLGW